MFYGSVMERSSESEITLPPDKWLAVAVAVCSGFLLLVASALLPMQAILTAIGLLVCALLGFVIASPGQPQLRAVLPTELETPLVLASDELVYDRYNRIAKLLIKVSRQQDPIYRSIAIDQLDNLVKSLTSIASGTLTFEGTETWRIVYELLLRSPGLYLYRSVAWIKNANYWQDEPGRKSLQVNYELFEQERINIERIAIINDGLWPLTEPRPVEPVLSWLHEQHARGIWIKIVRESALRSEPDLVADIGIYGSRALGIQELDEECRTERFLLTFDFARVADAEGRWNRLAVYAESYGVHLDRTVPIG